MSEGADHNGQTLRERIGIISADELAEMLCVSTKTLQRMRRDRSGPRFIMLSRQALYRISDVNEWLEAQLTNSQEDDILGEQSDAA